MKIWGKLPQEYLKSWGNIPQVFHCLFTSDLPQDLEVIFTSNIPQCWQTEVIYLNFTSRFFFSVTLKIFPQKNRFVNVVIQPKIERSVQKIFKNRHFVILKSFRIINFLSFYKILTKILIPNALKKQKYTGRIIYASGVSFTNPGVSITNFGRIIYWTYHFRPASRAYHFRASRAYHLLIAPTKCR